MQFHGDFGPGGGFQAGVILAAAVIFYALIFGLADARAVVPEPLVESMMAIGVLLYAGVGVAGLLLGGNFLDYFVLDHDPVHGQQRGIFWVEVGVAVTVVGRDAEDLLHVRRPRARRTTRERRSRCGLFAATSAYFVTIFLMMAGCSSSSRAATSIKKLVGLGIFQTSVYLLYIAPGKLVGGTAPIIERRPSRVYSNPLPHVLILTAIVVGVATLALGLALVVRIREAYDTHRGRRDPARSDAGAEAAHPPRHEPRRQHLPALQVVVPLLAAPLTVLLRRRDARLRRRRWRRAGGAGDRRWRCGCRSRDGGTISYAIGNWPPPWGIEYRVDRLNAFVLVLVVRHRRASCCRTAAPASQREIPPQQHYLFYTMFALCLAGLLGIAITGDAFNIFVFLEISSLSTYVLIALGRDRRALVAVLPVPDHGHDRRDLHRHRHRPAVPDDRHAEPRRHGRAPARRCRARARCSAALAFLTVGVSLKLALFPLHQWLPNAYAYAPSAVSAFLAGDRDQGRGLRAAALLLHGVRPVAGLRAACRCRRCCCCWRWPACSAPRRSPSSRPT